MYHLQSIVCEWVFESHTMRGNNCLSTESELCYQTGWKRAKGRFRLHNITPAKSGPSRQHKLVAACHSRLTYTTVEYLLCMLVFTSWHIDAETVIIPLRSHFLVPVKRSSWVARWGFEQQQQTKWEKINDWICCSVFGRSLSRDQLWDITLVSVCHIDWDMHLGITMQCLYIARIYL